MKTEGEVRDKLAGLVFALPDLPYTVRLQVETIIETLEWVIGRGAGPVLLKPAPWAVFSSAEGKR